MWSKSHRRVMGDSTDRYCAPNTMDGFPTISRHCRIVCIELQREMHELRKPDEELKETIKKQRGTMKEMKEKWEQW